MADFDFTVFDFEKPDSDFGYCYSSKEGEDEAARRGEVVPGTTMLANVKRWQVRMGAGFQQHMKDLEKARLKNLFQNRIVVSPVNCEKKTHGDRVKALKARASTPPTATLSPKETSRIMEDRKSKRESKRHRVQSPLALTEENSDGFYPLDKAMADAMADWVGPPVDSAVEEEFTKELWPVDASDKLYASVLLALKD